MSSIFLSHSHIDKSFARALSEQLQAHGIRTWLDEAEMQVGDSLIAKIGTAIKDFAYLGVILSPHSVESSWVHLEVRTALTEEIRERRVKVLPLLYQECSIPPFLQDKIYADFTKEFECGFEKLLSRLTADLDTNAYRQGRVRDSILMSYQDWVSFGKRDGDLLSADKLMPALEYVELDSVSARLLEYLIRSAATSGQPDVSKLGSALGRINGGDAELIVERLLVEGSLRVRLAVARLLSRMELGEHVVSRLLDRLGTEPDIHIRRALYQCADRNGRRLPDELTSTLLRHETDWLSRSYLLQSVAGRRRALLLSDASDFASDLGGLASAAGFEIVTVPPLFPFGDEELEGLDDRVLNRPFLRARATWSGQQRTHLRRHQRDVARA